MGKSGIWLESNFKNEEDNFKAEVEILIFLE